MKLLQTAALLLTMSILAACAGLAPLPPKSTVVPAGMDLSGRWQLRDNSRDSNRRIQSVEREAAQAGTSLIPKSKNSKQRKSDATQVHVFLETGESLKVTQTEHGLFVSFDRAIVEEYRFGEQRRVNVGPIGADRVSGWEDGAYVIETRDKEGAMLFETYGIDQDDLLIRTIRIVHDEDVVLDVRQEFDRV